MTTILSFDPGGTTGYAYIEYGDTYVKMLESGQIPDGLQGFINWWPEPGNFADVIVCESFELREGIHGVNLTPCYVMGALEVLAGDMPIVYQKPTFKGFCDNQALKNLDMYIKGQGHARDAVRHAIAYLLTKEHHKPTMKLGWPDEA